MSNALVTMGELERMASAMASSGLFGVKTSDQALALMLVAQAQGISPATACVDFDVIQGKPAMTARAMLARFQQAGGIIKWIEYTDTACEAEFSHQQCPDPIKIRWTMQDAARAGLTGKDNWRKYPRQMLSSRVMSEGVDRCYPAASGGFYPPEVVRDFTEKDITPTAGALGALPAKTQEAVIETAEQCKALLANDQVHDAFVLWQDSRFDADEEVAFWSLFDSKQRALLKRVQESEKAAEAGVISPAAKKRLEAKIKELGADREGIKAFCKMTYSKEHFQDLTKEEYQHVDSIIEDFVPDQATAADSPPAPPSGAAVVAPINAAGSGQPSQQMSELPSHSPETVPAAPNGMITETQILALENALDMGGKTLHNRFKAKLAVSGIKSIAEIPVAKLADMNKWISAQIDRQNAEQT